MDFAGETFFLNEQERAARVRVLLGSPGWTQDLVPALQRARQNAVTLLLDPSLARRDQLSDDYLRARVHVLDELLALPQNLLDSVDANRQAEQDRERAEADYQARAALGRIAPFGGELLS